MMSQNRHIQYLDGMRLGACEDMVVDKGQSCTPSLLAAAN